MVSSQIDLQMFSYSNSSQCDQHTTKQTNLPGQLAVSNGIVLNVSTLTFDTYSP